MRPLLVFLGLAELVAQAANVRGVVLDATTGKPLQGVHIRLYQQSAIGRPPYGAISDAAGRFSIDSVVPDSYGVFADFPGHVEAALFNAFGNRRQSMVTPSAQRPVEELNRSSSCF